MQLGTEGGNYNLPFAINYIQRISFYLPLNVLLNYFNSLKNVALFSFIKSGDTENESQSRLLIFFPKDKDLIVYFTLAWCLVCIPGIPDCHRTIHSYSPASASQVLGLKIHTTESDFSSDFLATHRHVWPQSMSHTLPVVAVDASRHSITLLLSNLIGMDLECELCR